MKVKNLKDLGLVVIESELTMNIIKKLMKHTPDALTLKDDNNETCFRISDGTEAAVSNFGIVFNKVTTAGNAALYLEANLTKEQIAEKYSVALKNLLQVEAQAQAAAEVLTDELSEVASVITEEPEEVEE